MLLNTGGTSPGLRRAPRTTVWGWTSETVAQTHTPTLVVAGVHDAQVPQERARHLHEDLGAQQKVFVDLGCSSHNAMWELNRTLLFEASREWLAEGTVKGAQEGIQRMGY